MERFKLLVAWKPFEVEKKALSQELCSGGEEGQKRSLDFSLETLSFTTTKSHSPSFPLAVLNFRSVLGSSLFSHATVFQRTLKSDSSPPNLHLSSLKSKFRPK